MSGPHVGCTGGCLWRWRILFVILVSSWWRSCALNFDKSRRVVHPRNKPKVGQSPPRRSASGQNLRYDVMTNRTSSSLPANTTQLLWAMGSDASKGGLKQVPFGGYMRSLSGDSPVWKITWVILTIFCVLVVAAILFEIFMALFLSDCIFATALPPLVWSDQNTKATDIFRGIPELTSSFFRSPAGAAGSAYVVVVLAIIAIGMYSAYAQNAWRKFFFDALEAKNSGSFFFALQMWFLLMSLGTVTQVYSAYIQSLLIIQWREFLTRRYINHWLRRKTYFFMQFQSIVGVEVDNPEQRIQDDVNTFVTMIVDLTHGFVRSLGDLVVFVPLLWQLEPAKAFGMDFVLPGWLLYFTFGWSALGLFITHFIGWELIPIAFSQQRYEADFRCAAMQVRENSEAIAMYNAERHERDALRQRFGLIMAIFRARINKTKVLSFFTHCYKESQTVVPYFFLAASYFNGDVSLGGLLQVVSCVSHVWGSLDYFLSNYGGITDLRATTDRLLTFEDAMQKTWVSVGKSDFDDDVADRDLGAKGTCRGEISSDEGRGVSPAVHDKLLVAKFAEIRSPSGDVLWEQFELDVFKGDRILISGPESSGKSVLLKAIASAWPGTLIDGPVIQFLGDAAVLGGTLFVPESLATQKGGTLREAISYPESAEEYSESSLNAALREVGLDCLLELDGDASGGDIHCVLDQPCRLTPVVQQRLAFGHALSQRPAILFLDGITSNIGQAETAELYASLTKFLPDGAAVISISKDVETMKPLHNRHLVVFSSDDGSPSWKIQDVHPEGLPVTP